MVDCKPENIVARLRQTVNNGKLGKDYTIISRDKNKLLRENYYIDDNKIKEILLDIKVEEYLYSEQSNSEEFFDDIVHIFIKDVCLIRKYSTNIEPEKIRIYIKFTWSVSLNKKMVIISFHEENDI